MTARPETLTAKGNRRRQALLRAAVDVIAEKGYAGVTHRAVAEHAGVPVASTSYFFSSIHELTREAAALYQAERHEQYLSLIELFAEERRSPAEGCELLVTVLLSVPTEWVLAHYEFYLNAGRVPELRPTVEASFDGFERVSEAALQAVGARRPKEGARALVAMVDGFMLRHLAMPSPDDAAVMEQAFREVFITYAMDQDELDRWMERSEQPADTTLTKS